MSREVIAAWTAFARSGDPSTAELPWTRWSGVDGGTMVFERHCSGVVEQRDRARWALVKRVQPGW